MSHLLENIAGMGTGGFGFLVDRAEQGEMSRSAGPKDKGGILGIRSHDPEAITQNPSH
jgi:hypothetical protein